jgi:crossover junction endodeoxyribonuclease RuvC
MSLPVSVREDRLPEHMFDGRVLGVDPGTAAVGIAVVEGRPGRPAVVWSTTVRTPPGMATTDRLRRIHDGVVEAIRLHEPSVVAVERLMWGRNVQSAMEVARATGVIILAAAMADLPVEEYPPLQVKMAVTGVGNATKEAVRRSLTRVLGIEGVPTEPDAVDAVAVAVCHVQHARTRALMREAGT